MKALKIKLVYDRRKTVQTSKNLGIIEIYIYDSSCRKKLYLPTGISVLPKQFYQSKGERACVVKHPNSTNLNSHLEKVYREVEAFAYSEKCQTIDDIKRWNDNPEDTESVISFIEKELVRKNPKYTTLTQHQTLIKRIKQFGKIHTFSDLTYENIIEFDAFIKSDGEDRLALGTVTAKKRHSMLKAYIVEAINRGICTYNPYITFNPKRGRSKDPVYLTEQELKSMKDYDLEAKVDSDRLIKVRDTFVFQCYTGLAYVDLKAFSKKDISEIDGKKVIRSSRHKTEQEFITVLLPEALAILKKYNYQLPVLSNQKYNDYLKLLTICMVDKKGRPIISKTLTSHVARHTCGTYLINKGVPIETVARMLGHSNTKMTRHYARLLGKTVVEDISKYVIDV